MRLSIYPSIGGRLSQYRVADKIKQPFEVCEPWSSWMWKQMLLGADNLFLL